MSTLRIGELSRRTGVSRDTLRAWERRYGLLRPVRTEGGFRLYSADDERRIRDMQRHLERGVAAAQAARLVEADGSADGSTSPSQPNELFERLLAFDDEAANHLLDRAVSRLSAESVLQELVLPVLRRIGDGWERGEVSIAQEHFASNLVRGRLLGLSRGWDQGSGPRALLACAPGELHDIPLIAFGIALRARGWRIVFLGADTPLETVRDAAAAVEPDLVVVAASRPEPEVDLDELRRLGETAPLVLAGPWRAPEWAACLQGDPVDAARAVAAR